MRIKTITCHQVYNYGASLQAYALMHYLSGLGHEVEVIDYMPDYIRKHLGVWDIGPRWKKRNLLVRLAYYCYMVPKRLVARKGRRKFDEFTKGFMKLTKRYNSFGELKITPPQADVYFCGSDQIWNPAINNGLDPAFYVDFAPEDAVRASYAASFSVSSIEDRYRDFISDKISKLDFVSVREKTGIKIIHEDLKIDKEVVNVLDPVFLLSREHWEKMTYIPPYTDYILVYDQENSSEIKEIAVSISNKTGKKIVTFKGFYPLSYADVKIKQSGPLDFISFIAHADCVVTNSFHCSAFSIIFGRDFYVVPRNHQKVNSRMADLLASLRIEDHMIVDASMLGKATAIDYVTVHEQLSLLRKQSSGYIDRVLAYKKK